MEGVEKIREGLYIKKSFSGYKVVYPIKNDNGSLNWFNILTGGSYWELLKTLLVFLVIILLCFSYYHDTKQCFQVIKNPCKYCNNVVVPNYNIGSLDKLNLTISNPSISTPEP